MIDQSRLNCRVGGTRRKFSSNFISVDGWAVALTTTTFRYGFDAIVGHAPGGVGGTGLAAADKQRNADSYALLGCGELIAFLRKCAFDDFRGLMSSVSNPQVGGCIDTIGTTG